MKTSMIKHGGTLVADNAEALELMSKIGEGTPVMVEIKLRRNVKNHRRFFAFLRTVFDMQDHFTEREAFRYWLIMKAGWFVTIEAPNGHIIFQPKSIDFSRMEEPEFQQVFSACIDVVCREFSLDKDELMRVVEYA
jgi:hypothetical protein